ncbi:FAD-dependent oxidoreductase [Micromonospora lutea]|uniref:Pentachlorophenol monooxygenase n=1 Tax=Micromonospora lutea TaxID=419825 RepID=A0ABQ4IWJ2_9ACTN|nr:FAD-dependent oxidoreductase [Micromonospora lutea]GIJ22175.1 pentachlorophenol monooxygenase [Micromonospora lutea]
MLPERTDVLVVGAGPTGLTAALTLARRGVEVTVVDQREKPAVTSRAAVVHAYTLEVLDLVGAGAALVARGLRSARFSVRDRDRVLVTVPFGGLPSRHRYALMVSQSVTEEVLTDRLAEAGVRVLRPYRLTGLRHDGDGTVADLDGTSVRARWVIGADGINSTVRELAGITFTKSAGSEESFVLADVRVDSVLPRDGASIFLARGGPLVWAPLPDGRVRLVATVADPPAEPDAAYLQRLLDERGLRQRPDQVREVLWSSRFRLHRRVAGTFRSGPVLLAGDAAHVHSPAGGQGMNLGISDAVDLGDTLADVLAGADETRLDEYAARRRPLAHEVADFADRLTRLATVPSSARPARDVLLRLISLLPPVRHRIALRLAGLNQRLVSVAGPGKRTGG